MFPAQIERASVTFSPTSAFFLHCLSLTFHVLLAQSILETTMRRRQDTWDRLQAEMSSKRVKAGDAMSAARKKKGSAPNEIIVQRLASEPDSKQTYRPVQPREFVDFQFEDLSLNNLKKACAAHFNLPVGTCDILVSNKGPSCSNIAQIPHRKDKVNLRS